jgi:hypothetical protein
VGDYNVASIRNRIDLQPSGQIISDATLPTVLGVPLGTCGWRIADLCRKSAIRDTHVAEARAMAAEQGRIAMAALEELAPSVYRESLAALIDEQLRREVFTPAPLGRRRREELWASGTTVRSRAATTGSIPSQPVHPVSAVIGEQTAVPFPFRMLEVRQNTIPELDAAGNGALCSGSRLFPIALALPGQRC